MRAKILLKLFEDGALIKVILKDQIFYKNIFKFEEKTWTFNQGAKHTDLKIF